jgi:hypothetical protein
MRGSTLVFDLKKTIGSKIRIYSSSAVSGASTSYQEITCFGVKI